MSSVIRITLSILASLTLLPALAQAGHHEDGDHSVAAEVSGDDVVWASGGRALVAEVEGEVIAVDRSRSAGTHCRRRSKSLGRAGGNGPNG